MFCLVFRCLANHSGFILSLANITRLDIHLRQCSLLTTGDVKFIFQIVLLKILKIFFAIFWSDLIRLLAIL